MLKTLKKIGLLSLVVILGLSIATSSAQAAKIPRGAKLTNESGFGSTNNTSARLYRKGGRLIAITDNNEVYLANKKVTKWTQIYPNFTQDENNTYGPIIIYKDYIYLAFNNDKTGVELWKLALPQKPRLKRSWVQVNEDGFGDADNTTISHLWKYKGKLYVFVVNKNGYGLVLESSDGKTFMQVGVNGLIADDPVEEVTSARIYKTTNSSGVVTDEEVVYVSTKDGRVLRTSYGDWENWVMDKQFNDETDNLIKYKGKLYVSEKDTTNGVKLYRTIGDSTWTQVNEDGFGDTHNINITGIHKTKKKKLIVYTYNNEYGANSYISRTGKADWKNLYSNGFGNNNNIAIADLIEYHHMKIASTLNKVNGTEIYKIKAVPIKPIIITPEDGAELTDTTVTVEGRVPLTLFNKRAKVKVWVNNQYDGRVSLNHDGSFSYEIDNLEEGENTLKFRTVVKGKFRGKGRGNEWYRSAFTEITVTVTTS